MGNVSGMARPKGLRLSPSAWNDVLRLKRLTLSEVAELADINRATISGLVGGHARASLPMARQLADALEVDAETLFPTLRHRLFAEVAA